MSVRSTLYLLVVLTCYLDNSVLAAIGDSCTTSDDCRPVNNTECANSACTCISGFVAGSGNNQCLRKVGHGESCTESIQCQDLPQAECVTNTCQCASSFIFIEGQCVATIALGQPCARDVECFVPHDPTRDTVWCFNAQCSCRRGYRRDMDRCVIGGDCTENVQCEDLRNSHCDIRPRDRHQCACAAGFIAVRNNTRCFQITTTIGGGCEYDEQCSRNLGTAACINNQCGCVAGTSVQNNTCGFQGDCLTDNDCRHIQNSYCDKQVEGKYQCACNDSFIFVLNNTRCLTITTTIGGRCDYDEQCSRNLGTAACINNQCRCVAGTSVQNDNTCGGAAVRIVLSLSCFVLVGMFKLL